MSHGRNRREHPVSDARLHGTAGGLCAVRLGGVEVRGARCLDRLGSSPTGSKPRFPDEQHALFGVALGDGTAFGQPPACDFGQTRSRRLAGQVWASSACAGNLCGSRSFQGNLLPGGQLVAARLDAGTHPQRSQPLPPRYGQGRVSLSAQPGLPGKTLRMVAMPDITVRRPVERCSGCGRSLAKQPPDRVERRQVFDLPHPKLWVTGQPV